jgi:hypothetical protein
MYKIEQVGKYASILRDGSAIGPLSGLYMADEDDVAQIREIVRLANIGLEHAQGKEE